MLRILILLLLTSCTLGSSRFGGKRTYQYESQYEYSSQELGKLSRDTVTSYKRDPRESEWSKVFTKTHPIRKTSTLSFETIIQPTRSGVAGLDKVYLSPKGKQLLTKKLLSVWEEAYTTVVDQDLSYVPMEKLFDNHKLHQKYGLGVKDYGVSFQDGLEGDDIFFKEKGKSLSSLALFRPHFARDLSLLLVPAHQLFGGPRGNDFQRYYIQEVSEQFGLDALYSILVEIDWHPRRVDKLTQQSHHQKAVLKLKVTPVLSYKEFEKRLKAQGIESNSKLPNLNWGIYEVSLDIPIDLDKISKESSLEEIDSILLRPIFKTYADMCVMMSQRLQRDFKRMKIE